MINQQIINIQGRMFQVKRRLPLNQLNLDKHKDWASLLKQYYHVDSLFKAEGKLWLCNEIKTIEYEEIPKNKLKKRGRKNKQN
jgi:hypothetical protein